MSDCSPSAARSKRYASKDRLATIVIYAMPGLALAIPVIPAYVFLPSFYADRLGLGLAAVGGILFIARLIDALSDPLVGFLSDRIDTPIGRRKPWIILGAIIAGIALVNLFTPPEDVTRVYLLAWAGLMYIGWTFVQVPYTAWLADLSDDHWMRVRLTGGREGAQLTGILLAGAIPAIGSQLGWSQTRNFEALAWLAVVLGALTLGLLIWRLPSASPKRALSLDWRTMARNKPFVRLIGAWFTNGLANGIPAALFPLYLAYGLKADDAQQNMLIAAYFGAAVLFIPLWIMLTKAADKHRVWSWAMIAACAAFICVPFLSAGDIAAFAVICVITGAALGADLALPPAMQAEVVDYDRLKFDQERAGLFFAGWSVATKFALVFAVGIPFPVLDYFGLGPGGPDGDSAVIALVVIYAVVPVVLKLLAIATVWNHPITSQRHDMIRRRLNAKRRRQSRIRNNGHED